MTTEITEVVDELTEETTNGYTDGYVAKKKDRELNTLLNLDSYDDLTDGEVKALLNWERSQAHWDEEITILRVQTQATMEQVTESETQAVLDTQSVLLF